MGVGVAVFIAHNFTQGVWAGQPYHFRPRGSQQKPTPARDYPQRFKNAGVVFGVPLLRTVNEVADAGSEDQTTLESSIGVAALESRNFDKRALAGRTSLSRSRGLWRALMMD